MFSCKSFIFILLFCTAATAYTQPYYFRHYQVENGLSNNAAICCVQDGKGFLWFGTKDGLNRFDGYTFKTFRSTPGDSGSIGSNFIHCLFEDSNGILWAGTERGLYKYNALNESFILVKVTDNNPIRDIGMDNKGQLWFIMGFTLFKYAEAKQKLDMFPIGTYFEATSLCTSKDGSLWAASSNGILKKYNDQNNSFESYDVFANSKPTTSHWIEKIYSTTNGQLLIGTATQGVKMFNMATHQYKDILTYNTNKTEIFVRNFVQTSDHEYWIATESGIFIYNTATGQANNLQKTYNDPYSISDNAVYSFCKDKEGGIWAGTYFGGINYYPSQHTPFKKLFPQAGENTLSGNVVREIHQDNYGNLWVGTEDAGLNKINPSTGKFTYYKPTGSSNSIAYSNIHGLHINGDELWIGTFEHGLDVMNVKTGTILKHYSAGNSATALKSDFIYCITQTNDGNIILGTTRGAYMYNRKQNNFSQLPYMPVNNWYSYLLQDKRGVIWAATYGHGINFYNTATGKGGNFKYDVSNKNSIASNRVNSIFEDSNKDLWFATEAGLCKLNSDAKSFTTYSVKNGFPSDFILSILEDKKKNLWISTSKGLVRFNTKTANVKTYTTINGILNDQFNFNSAFKDSTGRMYFGSVKGLINFDPVAFKENEFVPPVYITGFQVFNKDLAIAQTGSPLKNSIINTNNITLNYDQATISIDFAALSYTAPEMCEYTYTMQGLEKSWTFLKQNRKVYFTNLSPGSYTFKVKASNTSGIWNNSETQLIIEILPPWWASKWAYAGYALAVILLVWYFVYLYHKNIEARNKRKFEVLEIAKEKEIYEAKIGFFTNVAHEIKTPLTLISAPLEKVIKKSADNPDIINNLKIMERNTNRLIDLTNQLLDFRQTEINGFSLNFVNANINELLEDTCNSFKPLCEQKNIHFTVSLPPNIVYAYVDLDAFNKILYNLFSNSVKYAASKVDVYLPAVNATDNVFTIYIKNDGFIIPAEMSDKIFEPFFRLKETEKQKGTGIGLALSRSLAQLHKGELCLKEPEYGMNVFALSLPLHQDNEFNFWNNKQLLSV